MKYWLLLEDRKIANFDVVTKASIGDIEFLIKIQDTLCILIT